MCFQWLQHICKDCDVFMCIIVVSCLNSLCYFDKCSLDV